MADFKKAILKIGTWMDMNGRKVDITESVIDEIIAAFTANVRPDGIPLKLGHNDSQKLLQVDGLPAAGWVTGLEKSGDLLVAEFSNVPDKIKTLIENKGYKNVSSEIFRNVKDQAKKVWKNVLGAVALLGIDAPAIKGLGDFAALYSEQSGNNVLVFAETENNLKEVKILTEVEHMDDVTKLTETLATKEAEIGTLKASETSLKDENAQLKTKLAAADAEKARVLSEQRLSEIGAFVDAQVKLGHVLPKHKDYVVKVMFALDDGKMLKFAEADGKEVEKSVSVAFKQIFETMPSLVSFEEQAQHVTKKEDESKKFSVEKLSEGFTADESMPDSEGQKFEFMTRKFMAVKKVDYKIAQQEVSKIVKEEQA